MHPRVFGTSVTMAWLWTFKPAFPSITAAALSRDTTPFASRERGQGRRRRLSQTLDAATGSLDSIRDEAQGRELGFVLSRIFRLVSTKARFLESYGGLGYHQPSIRSSIPDHDSFSELPLRLQGEAGRSINLSMDGGPPRKCPSYPACEPVARGRAASRSIQYNRTANLRAMATFATPLPRRNFNRR